MIASLSQILASFIVPTVNVGRIIGQSPIFLAAVMMSLTACVSVEGEGDPRDPWESWNRGVFNVNTAIDKNALGPLARGYKAVTPEPVRDGVTNVVLNLREPLTFANELLQGKIGRAGTTLGRFLLNSTLGIGGLFNIAENNFGIDRTTEDVGQTLAVWGVTDGPYVVLPFFGPSSVRDGVGTLAGAIGDPTRIGLDNLNVEGLVLSRAGVDALDSRARFDSTIRALYEERDPYVFARSAYFQQRAFAICNGRCVEDEDEEDLFDTLEDQDGEDEDEDDRK